MSNEAELKEVMELLHELKLELVAAASGTSAGAGPADCGAPADRKSQRSPDGSPGGTPQTAGQRLVSHTAASGSPALDSGRARSPPTIGRTAGHSGWTDPWPQLGRPDPAETGAMAATAAPVARLKSEPGQAA